MVRPCLFYRLHNGERVRGDLLDDRVLSVDGHDDRSQAGVTRLIRGDLWDEKLDPIRVLVTLGEVWDLLAPRTKSGPSLTAAAAAAAGNCSAPR